MENSNTIGSRIKSLRQSMKLNQIEFAKTLGIKQSTLSSYENGVVSPSSDILLTIAENYHISLDWLFGLSDNQVNMSSIADFASSLFQLNDKNEVRFELDINEHLPNDLETENNRWTASITFYGNDKEHDYNAVICQFLSSFKENRDSFEHYFTTKELFDLWKEKELQYYKELSFTQKKYKELDNKTRLQLQKEYLLKEVLQHQQETKKKP